MYAHTLGILVPSQRKPTAVTQYHLRLLQRFAHVHRWRNCAEVRWRQLQHYVP